MWINTKDVKMVNMYFEEDMQPAVNAVVSVWNNIKDIIQKASAVIVQMPMSEAGEYEGLMQLMQKKMDEYEEYLERMDLKEDLSYDWNTHRRQHQERSMQRMKVQAMRSRSWQQPLKVRKQQRR